MRDALKDVLPFQLAHSGKKDLLLDHPKTPMPNNLLEAKHSLEGITDLSFRRWSSKHPQTDALGRAASFLVAWQYLLGSSRTSRKTFCK
mmetsp:Transcript_9784/g.59537  ORF Transcript_9784/g.59537 Transcript_9784/m.59537 type:complete len:89 (+) Transcript_9784:993-1259(+)